MTRRALVAALALSLPGTGAAQNVAEVQVAPPSITIRVGERSGLLATAFDRIGNVIPTVRIIWSSNNVSVARVDNNGTVTGVANGVAIVEARVGIRKGQAAVQVIGGATPPPQQQTPPGGADPLAGQPAGSGPAAALRLEPPAIYLLPSENTRVSPRALREDGSPAAPVVAIWTSLRSDVASVDQNGNVVMLSPGDLDTLHVIVPSQNGRTVNPLALQWASSDQSIARVSLAGVVTAAGPGRATLTVSGLLQSKSIEVSVHRVVAKMEVRPRYSVDAQVPLTASMKFEARALADDGTAIPEAPLRWSVSDPAVATFDAQTGILTGKAVGRTQLTVRGRGSGLAVTWNISVIAGPVKFAQPRVGVGLNQ